MRPKSRQIEEDRLGEGRRAYRIGLAALVPGLAGAVAVLQSSRMTVGLDALASYVAILLLLFAAHGFYAKVRPARGLALATGGMAVMITSALLAGIIANAGMRLRYPLIDAALASADRAIGIDTPALVRAFAERPFLAELMNVAYSSIFPLAFLAAILLALRGDAARLWELATGFGAGILLSASASVFFPALGNFSHAGLESLVGSGLPAGSGIYHLHAVAAYRDGLEPLLDVRKLEGVVTFPSFHMVMALIVAHAFRSTGAVGWVAGAWCALVAVSTVPIGGHYVIDLLAGTVVWLVLRWTCAAPRPGGAERSAIASVPINGLPAGAA